MYSLLFKNDIAFIIEIQYFKYYRGSEGVKYI